MIILGILFCVVGVFLISKRFIYIFLGKCVKGIIIGYGEPIKSYKGIESYPYKVKYKYDDKEYIAYSIESVTTSYSNFPNKNLRREITVYFKKDKPDVVTIKELNSTLIIGILFLIIGMLGIVL